MTSAIPKIPKHVAIIMDGNGRWAQGRSHSRIWGHVRGAAIVSQIVEEADNLGVEALTLYAFSTENWSRPFKEVSSLFLLLKKFLRKEKLRIIKNNIKFNIIGDISKIPESTQELISSLREETKGNSGLKLTFAFGYGGRAELVHAFNSFIEQNPNTKISVKDIENHLYTNDLSDVDLLIRTGGDQRVSNFLLWQIAYAELLFTDTKWPEFTREEFKRMLYMSSLSERRFGAIHSQDSLKESELIARKQNIFFKRS